MFNTIKLHLILKLILLILLFPCNAVIDDFPITQIKQGRLVGEFRHSSNGRKFSAFIGIPYAKPPIGELRFKAPVPADAWNGILNASQPRPICTQTNAIFNDYEIKGNEDCLYLNVYTPSVGSKKLPVMFYIHCGGFMWGSAYPDLHGPEHFLDKDIVVVSASYRLGALGFLSTGDEIVPGNNGLKDQNLALQWTWNNIEQFGGDPKQITVFGQSAGGISSHYHMLSPLSKDLIKGAIANSGTALNHYSLSPKLENQGNSRKLAQLLNCPSNSSIEMVKCLQKVDAYSIVEQELKLYVWTYIPVIPYKPVIEPNIKGAFLTEDPRDILKSGKAANVPFLTGMTKDDGTLLSAGAFRTSEITNDLHNRFDKLLPKMLGYENTSPDPDEVTCKIREYYFNNTRTVNPSSLTRCATASWFRIGLYETVQMHMQYYTAPVYQYSFNYRGSRSFSECFGTDVDYGVSHCDDLLYLITTGYLKDYKPKIDEKTMTNVMVNMWTNFITTGNPTPPVSDLQIPITWKPVTTDHLEYLSIDSATNIQMKQDSFLEEIKFWKELPLNTYDNQIIKDNL